jgi:hypothetical protein
MVSVSAVKSNPPTPRSHALARAAQQRERVARRRERDARHWERRKRRNEEFRLREQQGLSSPGTEEYSSSDEEEEEEEEEVREQVLPDRWEPAPLSPEPAPVAGGPSPGAGAEAPVTRQSTTEAARAAEARATGASVRAVGAPARKAGPARGGDGWGCGGGRARNVGGGLEEEEARLLLLEVRNCLSRGCVPDRRGPDGLFPCSQGGANCAPPRASQGAEGGRVHPDQAMLIEGTTGERKHDGSGERGLARCGRGLGVTAGGLACRVAAGSR